MIRISWPYYPGGTKIKFNRSIDGAAKRNIWWCADEIIPINILLHTYIITCIRFTMKLFLRMIDRHYFHPIYLAIPDCGSLKYHSRNSSVTYPLWSVITQITKFMGPTWGPTGSCRPQMDPMLAPWTLLSGYTSRTWDMLHGVGGVYILNIFVLTTSMLYPIIIA